MPENGKITRTRNLTSEIADANASMRETVQRSREILKEPPPDTFLGRKTHEPFPIEKE
ncbi:hypothetical protein [Bradyrhizobium sp. DASA03007]|uniref:hypothetical protein n=1 Tax=unclassified Bradyrhizobium TaxID=2631580 RepID=UPI003F721898